jgi:hypothetical protein
MSLTILSNNLQTQESVFASITLTVLKANLFCAINDSALNTNGAIRDIDIRRYFGNKEDDYEYFLIDIHDTEWSINSFSHRIFKRTNATYYLLAGTDNAPSKLCYDFSLAYLRLRPDHLISIYHWVFSLEDIERLEQSKGWCETWYKDFNKLDITPSI